MRCAVEKLLRDSERGGVCTPEIRLNLQPAAVQALLELIAWIIDDCEMLCLDCLVITAIYIKNYILFG